jgi:hypothetical protein
MGFGFQGTVKHYYLGYGVRTELGLMDNGLWVNENGHGHLEKADLEQDLIRYFAHISAYLT